MKSKKLFLPAVILAVAIILIAVFSVVMSIAKKPTITEMDFPFSITYEFKGETVTIDDVYSARYDRNDGYADTKTRVYVGGIESLGEEETAYCIQDNDEGKIVLYTNLYSDYMMGDSDPRAYSGVASIPQICIYDAEGNEFTDEETLEAHDVKIISYDIPEPIENTFVFSHISTSSISFLANGAATSYFFNFSTSSNPKA